MILWTDEEIAGKLRTAAFIGKGGAEEPLVASVRELLTDCEKRTVAYRAAALADEHQQILDEAKAEAHQAGYEEGFEAHRKLVAIDIEKARAAALETGVSIGKERKRLDIRNENRRSAEERAVNADTEPSGNDWEQVVFLAEKIALDAADAENGPRMKFLARTIAEEIRGLKRP